MSPASTKPNKPLFFTISRSDIDPTYRLGRKVICPDGAIPSKNLNVLWDYYVEYVEFWASTAGLKCLFVVVGDFLYLSYPATLKDFEEVLNFLFIYLVGFSLNAIRCCWGFPWMWFDVVGVFPECGSILLGFSLNVNISYFSCQPANTSKQWLHNPVGYTS